MPVAAVSYLGAKCSGHVDWPSRPNTSASSDVFVNTQGDEVKGVHRESDTWESHCNTEKEKCHTSYLESGSSTVYVNNLQCGRFGDPVHCGSLVAEGSPNVFCG
jgi:uncharacterized Zn-binding protein involved in type VI secretion